MPASRSDGSSISIPMVSLVSLICLAAVGLVIFIIYESFQPEQIEGRVVSIRCYKVGDPSLEEAIKCTKEQLAENNAYLGILTKRGTIYINPLGAKNGEVIWQQELARHIDDEITIEGNTGEETRGFYGWPIVHRIYYFTMQKTIKH